MMRRIFLAGAGAALTGGCAGLSAETVAETWPPLGRMIEVDGLPVHVWQQGSGPDVILIHGASGNLRDFTFALAPRLAQRFRVTVFDRPGLGYSARLAERGWDPSAQAAHLARAADQLGLQRPVVLGHSWGGALAMAWAVAEGERLSGAVSLSGATMPWGGDLAFFYSVLSWPVTGTPAAWLIHQALSPEQIDGFLAETFAPQPVPAGYGAYIGGPLATRPETLVANARDLTRLNTNLERLSRAYPSVACPVEILHGTADDTVPHEVHAGPMHALLPHSRVTLLDGVGHMPHHADPDTVEAAIARLASG